MNMIFMRKACTFMLKKVTCNYIYKIIAIILLLRITSTLGGIERGKLPVKI